MAAVLVKEVRRELVEDLRSVELVMVTTPVNAFDESNVVLGRRRVLEIENQQLYLVFKRKLLGCCLATHAQALQPCVKPWNGKQRAFHFMRHFILWVVCATLVDKVRLDLVEKLARLEGVLATVYGYLDSISVLWLGLFAKFRKPINFLLHCRSVHVS